MLSSSTAAHDRMSIQFVLEVEKYPCLYNTRTPEYGRKDSTEKAWEEIGAKFNLPGAECKERWKNIRSVFVRQLKPPKPGSGRVKKPYYLSEYLQFALPFVKQSTLDQPDPRRLLYQHLAENDVNDDDTPVEIFSTNALHELQPELTESQPKSDLEESQGLPRRPSLFLGDHPSPSPSEHIVQAEKTLKRKHDYGNEQNSNRLFLLSLVSDMNKMNDKQRRVFRHKLLNLVDEILDGDDDDAKVQHTFKTAKQSTSSRTLIKNDILSSARIHNDISTDDDHINYIIKTEEEYEEE